tara:strand:+ start:62 stop:664 length:603 start_codon:yes stop_codon:yes gene_type:complete
MKSEYKIIDNVFSPEQFEDLSNYVKDDSFPWYYIDGVAYDEQNDSPTKEDEATFNVPMTDSQKEYNFMFVHSVFENHEFVYNEKGISAANTNAGIGSPDVWNLILPIFDVVSIKALIRCKINSYHKTHEIVHHKEHLDYSFEHKGAILYINSNDGLTVLEDGVEIESVANRLLLFNPSKPHHSTTCTNKNRRMNINFNYF